MTSEKKRATVGTAIFALNLIIAIGAISTGHFREWLKAGLGTGPANAVEPPALAQEKPASNEPPPLPSVDLSDTQLAALKVEAVGEYSFPIEKAAVGSIDFNEEMSLQVFPPYQGRILTLFATIGDEVKKGDTLFTIDSPDLLQAEIDAHQCRWCCGLDGTQSGAPQAALRGSRHRAEGHGAGRFRSAGRRRRAQGGA